MQIMKKFCIPSAKNKKDSHGQCKKQKEFALPIQKLEIICIVHANNEKDLHVQFQK